MRLRSRCASAAKALRTMVATVSQSSGVSNDCIGSGKMGSSSRTKPYTPSLDITPVNAIETGDGASE